MSRNGSLTLDAMPPLPNRQRSPSRPVADPDVEASSIEPTPLSPNPLHGSHSSQGSQGLARKSNVKRGEVPKTLESVRISTASLNLDFEDADDGQSGRSSYVSLNNE